MARHKQIDDETLIQKLTQVFRDFGYEGASLTNISKVTWQIHNLLGNFFDFTRIQINPI